MSTSPTYVRINDIVVSWGSAVFKVDNQPISGVVSCTYEQKRTRKIVRSNVPGAKPLGRPTGTYSIPTFTLRMLREDSSALDAYIALGSDNALFTPGQTADVEFSFAVQAIEETSGFSITAQGLGCLIDSKRSVYDEGVDALVDEYSISCLYINEADSNGARFLYSTSPNALDAMAQDYVTIGGQRSPGRATILDPKRQIGWDVRQAYGLSLATLVPKGNPPATFSIKFDLWDPDDLPVWNAFAKTYLKWALVRVPGSITNALTVSHPILQAQPIALAQCVVSMIHGFNKDDEGLWSCTVDFLEYGKPVLALQKAAGIIPGKTTPKPVALTAQQRALQQRQAEDAAAEKRLAAARAAAPPSPWLSE